MGKPEQHLLSHVASLASYGLTTGGWSVGVKVSWGWGPVVKVRGQVLSIVFICLEAK